MIILSFFVTSSYRLFFLLSLCFIISYQDLTAGFEMRKCEPGRGTRLILSLRQPGPYNRPPASNSGFPVTKPILFVQCVIFICDETDLYILSVNLG